MSAVSSRRFLSVWFGRLPTDRLARTAPPSKPRVVAAKQANALRLSAVDDGAAALGLHPGLALADARARHPQIDVAEADPAADRACLEKLAELARAASPVVALDGADALLLDVTGCAHLWGGEAAMSTALTARFARAGFAAQAGLADTAGLAWALARFGVCCIAKPGERRPALAPLPMAALRLPPETVHALARVGLKTAGQLMAAPRGPLARRFGQGVLDRLDQALGVRADPLDPKPETMPRRADLRLAEPIVSEAAVLQAAERLARDLALRLEREGAGGRRFVLELFRVDGAVKRLEVAASRPLRDPREVARLFAERLGALNEGLQADFGFDLVRLEAALAEPLRAAAPALPGGGAEHLPREEELVALGDRLAVRLGGRAVARTRPVSRHWPEQAVAPRPLAESRPAWRGEQPRTYDGAPLRPVRLFARPEPVEAVSEAPDGPPLRFTWRRVPRRIVRAEGPERIAGDWRKPAPHNWTRDYWRLEDERGRRYWLFRHGLYGEADAPHWYVHGLFP